MFTANADYGIQLAKVYRAGQIEDAKEYRLGRLAKRRTEVSKPRSRTNPVTSAATSTAMGRFSPLALGGTGRH